MEEEEKNGESDGERGELWGRAGELNLHARRVIWYRHGILVEGGGLGRGKDPRCKVEKRIQDNRMCM